MLAKTTFVALAVLTSVQAIQLDTKNFTSIRAASAAISKDLFDFYHGNEPGEIPGILDDPYYWWNGGALFDVLIQYSNLTGDAQYNEIVAQALDFQKGEMGTYLPRNQSRNLGNDDQSTWALAALSAAEGGFPIATMDYLGVAKAVFDSQAARWNDSACGGGLRWQIFSFNNGYNYKNSASNGQFFQLASRLARDTGNATYSEWATTAFEWTQKIGFMDDKWNVFDGALVDDNCKTLSKLQFSSNTGTYIVGAANLYNATRGDAKWKNALDGLLDRTLELFFPNGIAFEIACETSGSCNTDMKNFKGLLAHQLVDTIRAAPYTAGKIFPVLTSTAEAAARACNDKGEDCKFAWSTSSSNDSSELGPQLSALSYVQSLLLKDPSVASAGKPTSAQPSQSGTQTRPTSSGTSGTSTSTPPASSATTFAPKVSMVALAAFALVALAAL